MPTRKIVNKDNFESQKKKFYQPVAKPAMNQRVPTQQKNFSPDYQKSWNKQKTMGLNQDRPPVFSAPGFKGNAKKARIHSQQVQYGRERRAAQDKLNEIGMRNKGDMDVTRQVGQQRAGRQQAGFVQALQEQQRGFVQQSRMQQAGFGQQNRMQQAGFGQQGRMQQNRLDQRSLEQQNRFGQQNQLEQMKQEGERRKSALDYRLAGGPVAGAATINNGGYTDFSNIQPVTQQDQNKVNTYRALELGLNTETGNKTYGSFNSSTGAFSPLTLGERLTPGQ